MGNCLALPILKEDDQVLQVIKMDDGKIMEFKNPLLVKDMLVNYPNSYVGVLKEATHPLPMEYKLKIGKIYYLLPRGGSDDDHEEHRKIEAPAKRIKVVITKDQLQQLIVKQGRFEELVVSKVNIEPKKDCSFGHTCAASTTWLPKLESISEATEVEVSLIH